MSFRQAVFPHRNDRVRFPEILRDALRRGQFTRLVNPHMDLMRRNMRSETAIQGERCENRPSGLFWLDRRRVCNMTPTYHDRLAVETLLDAWQRRRISDRYLCLFRLRELHAARRERRVTVDAAYETLRVNAPSGAIRFAARQLPASRTRDDLPIFGDAIAPDMSLNIVFSALLVWDDLNCTGAIEWVTDQEARYAMADGGERAIDPFVAAAHRWLAEAQRRSGTIYKALGVSS